MRVGLGASAHPPSGTPRALAARATVGGTEERSEGMAKRRRRVPPRRPGQPALAPAPPSGSAKRVVLVLAVLFAVGLAVGAGVSFLVDVPPLFAADRARFDLARDTGGALADAASLADGGDPALFAPAALAGALLVSDHVGGADEEKRADARLRTTLTFVREAPEALYARALLARLGVADAAVDDDIGKRADKLADNAWCLLARSTRAWDRGDRDEAVRLARRAALGPGAPVRAQVELARESIAQGAVDEAGALAAHVEREHPGHVQARIAGILAAVIDDAREETPQERSLKLRRVKHRAAERGAAPRPGQAHDDDSAALALWHTAPEQAAIDALDSVDARDAPVLALVLEVFAAGRGDDALASEMKSRVIPGAASSAVLAARQAELSIALGDTAAAEELLTRALEENPDNTALLLDRARLRSLTALSDEEIHRRAGAFKKSIGTDAVALPFARAVINPFGLGGVPFRFEPDPGVIPEAELAAALSSKDVQKKLDVAVFVHKGSTALGRGDVPGAADAVARAREKAAGDPDVLLLDARVKQRQGDRDGARQAVDAAVERGKDDAHVLLAAARIHYDNEDFIPARKVLARLRALGFKSPAALALGAMLEARSGDARAAQALLAEAKDIGAGNVEIVKAEVLILRDGDNLGAVRAAADHLLAVDGLRTSDPILRSWEADSAARAGDTLRAQAVLEDVIASRENLADAHLLLGSIQAGTDESAARASFERAEKLAPGSAVASEASRRRATLKGGGEAERQPPPKQRPRRLPRKRGR